MGEPTETKRETPQGWEKHVSGGPTFVDDPDIIGFDLEAIERRLIAEGDADESLLRSLRHIIEEFWRFRESPLPWESDE